MKKYGGRKPTKRVYRRRARKSTAKPKVSTAVKKYVKNSIHRLAENKVLISSNVNQSLTTASASNPASINLCPTVAQGTSHVGRIGNEIKLVKGFIRGFVNLLPYNATTNPLSTPVMVKLWVCSNKKIQSTTFSSIGSGDFFEDNASTANFAGNLKDMMLSVNKENWHVYATKTFELGATYASSTGPTGTSGYFDNSKMIIPFYFNFGKHLKTTLKYNDTDTNPTNRNMFLLLQAVYADGSTSSVTPAEYHYHIRWEFEDL